MPSQLTIQNLPTIDLSFSTLHLDVDKEPPLSEHQNLVAAIKDHDLYDLTEQMELKDEWSKLLYWGALSICLFIFCYPVRLKIQNNRTPYMDRLILPPKYILFQSLKIPFQG